MGIRIPETRASNPSIGILVSCICKGWIHINPPCQRTSCTVQERVASDEAKYLYRIVLLLADITSVACLKQFSV